MAEHPRQQLQRHGEGVKSILPEKRPTTSQILVVLTLLPVGGFLLFLSGVTLSGTLIGLAVTTPLFVIFSPVLVPAALVISLTVMGFLASGAFVVTALSSLSWIANNFRRIKGGPSPNPQAEQVKQRTMEILGRVGQKTREAEQAVLTKAQEKTEGQEGTKSRGGGQAKT